MEPVNVSEFVGELLAAGDSFLGGLLTALVTLSVIALWFRASRRKDMAARDSSQSATVGTAVKAKELLESVIARQKSELEMRCTELAESRRQLESERARRIEFEDLAKDLERLLAVADADVARVRRSMLDDFILFLEREQRRDPLHRQADANAAVEERLRARGFRTGADGPTVPSARNEGDGVDQVG